MAVDRSDEKIVDVFGLSITYGFLAKCIIACAILWLIVAVIAGKYGATTIGSYLERDNYQANYWVYLQPNNNDSKNYRVQGTIEKVTDSEGTGYFLRNIHWPNGGSIQFEDCDISEAVHKRKATKCTVGEETYDVRLAEKATGTQ